MASSSQCAQHGMRAGQLDAKRTKARGKSCGLAARELEHAFAVVKGKGPI
ncbi:MAG: hypothetical protein JRF54_08690 [Deltaproteobacteria bacterium]|nr:hypothetical protein [Deltaproteobacteria bacterium]